MADVDKIASDALHRKQCKEQRKVSGLQPKDFIIFILLMLVGFSPLIAAIIMKVASLNA